MRIRLLIVPLILVLAAACGGSASEPEPTVVPTEPPRLVSAQALLTQSGDNVAAATSVHADFKMHMSAGDKGFRMSGEMDFEPGRARMTMRVAGQEIDVLIYGARFYMNIEDEWRSVDITKVGFNAKAFEDMLNQRGIIDYKAFSAPGVVAVDHGVRDLDGRKARHITTEMDSRIFDPGSASGQLIDPSLRDVAKDAFKSGAGEVFIDEDTGYPLRASVNVEMELQGEQVSVDIDMDFADFNEPVDIPAEPTDARPLDPARRD